MAAYERFVHTLYIPGAIYGTGGGRMRGAAMDGAGCEERRPGQGRRSRDVGRGAACGFRSGQSTQSAMNRFVSRGSSFPRFEANSSFEPSELNIGKPSKSPAQVIRSSPVPSSRIE
jgi:hypothetical protein